MPDQALRAEYEHGRSDGFADGAYDFRWRPAVAHDRHIELREEVGTAAALLGRSTRAYTLGFARGYREATEKGGRT